MSPTTGEQDHLFTDALGQLTTTSVAGITLQNGTFDSIWRAIQTRGKTGLVYGVTAAGVCALSGIERICPCGRES